MGVKTRFGVDLSQEGRPFWQEMLSLEAFVGVVTSAVGNANSADELFKLVHFIYWLAPPAGSSFQDGVRFLRKEVALLPRPKRRALQKAARAKLNGLDWRQMRAVIYGSGEKPSNQQDFYKSWEWRTLRMKVMKQRGLRCECCGATPQHHDTQGNPIRIVVDHIKPLATHWDLRLDPGNLQMLCDECNQGKGAWDSTDYRASSAYLS